MENYRPQMCCVGHGGVVLATGGSEIAYSQAGALGALLVSMPALPELY